MKKTLLMFVYGSFVIAISAKVNAQTISKLGLPAAQLVTLEDIARAKYVIVEKNIHNTQSYVNSLLPGGQPVVETLWDGYMVVHTNEGRCLRLKQEIIGIDKSPPQGNGATVQLPHTKFESISC